MAICEKKRTEFYKKQPRLIQPQQQYHSNSCFHSIISIYNVHRCSLIQLEDVAVVIHK